MASCGCDYMGGLCSLHLDEVQEDAMRGRSWEGNESIRDELPNAGKKPWQAHADVTAAISVTLDVMHSIAKEKGRSIMKTAWKVEVAGDEVELRYLGASGDIIKFSKAGMLAAIKILEDYNG